MRRGSAKRGHWGESGSAERLRLGVRGTTDDGRTISFEARGPSGGPMLVIVATLSQTPRGEAFVHFTLASEWLEHRRTEEGMLGWFGWLFPAIVPNIRGAGGKP